MTTELTLLKATIDAWAINAKRECEAHPRQGQHSDGTLCSEWNGQAIAFKRVQELLEKVGVK